MLKKYMVALWVIVFSFSAFAVQRNQDFLAKVRTYKTKKESVAYARSEIKNLDSKFRIDAVEFIREIKDVDSIAFLQAYVADRDINTFVIYALGDLEAFEATATLISLLNHSNPNVRGNAFAALGKIYPLDLPQGYAYKQPAVRRNKHVQNIEKWWESHGTALQKNYKRDLHRNQQEKQELWEKYGKNYLFKAHGAQ